MDWVLQSADYLSLILREMTPESDALLVCRAWRESIMSRKANPTTEITEYEDDMMVKWKLSMQDLNIWYRQDQIKTLPEYCYKSNHTVIYSPSFYFFGHYWRISFYPRGSGASPNIDGLRNKIITRRLQKQQNEEKEDTSHISLYLVCERPSYAKYDKSLDMFGWKHAFRTHCTFSIRLPVEKTHYMFSIKHNYCASNADWGFSKAIPRDVLLRHHSFDIMASISASHDTFD
jgi:hypothetical protein